MNNELTSRNGTKTTSKGRRQRLLMQEFGHLWTRIEHELPITSQTARKIGFCAANPGEGASSIALNYASILGQRRKRVTLLETNFRSPSLAKSLGIPSAPGLWELLENTADLSEATHNQVLDGVNVITAGNAPGDLVLQGSNFRLQPLFDQLAAHNDIIVVDVPPMSSSPESNLILPQLDGAVLVVQACRNRLCAVERTVKEMEHLGVPLLGCVLNRMRYDLPAAIDRLL